MLASMQATAGVVLGMLLQLSVMTASSLNNTA
jgi:hypothetical protein